MYRMSILALCTSDINLDIVKCTLMCVVHDIAEAQVGDIAPSDGISKGEKDRLESEAMRNIVHDMLHNSPAAQRIEALWNEYEAGETPEAKFVKDLDRFEMAIQASEYEQRHGINLQGFFDSSLPKIRHPQVQQWATDLEKERNGKSNGRTNDPTFPAA